MPVATKCTHGRGHKRDCAGPGCPSRRRLRCGNFDRVVRRWWCSKPCRDASARAGEVYLSPLIFD